MDKLIQFKGTIYEDGYGMIAKKVMRDKELSGYAKLLYSYLCSFAGNSQKAFPGRDLITYELSISKDTFTKSCKALIAKGYLSIKQERGERSKFNRNVYTIELSPCPSTPDTVAPDTVAPDTVEKDTNNNNLNNNNIINNNYVSKGTSPTHKFIPPTIEEVKSYCNERHNSVDAEKWYDFYTCKGWMVGKNKMKDWKAAVRTWERNKLADDGYNGRAFDYS